MKDTEENKENIASHLASFSSSPSTVWRDATGTGSPRTSTFSGLGLVVSTLTNWTQAADACIRDVPLFPPSPYESQMASAAQPKEFPFSSHPVRIPPPASSPKRSSPKTATSLASTVGTSNFSSSSSGSSSSSTSSSASVSANHQSGLAFDYETPVSTSTILELLASEAEAEAAGEGEEVTDRDHTSHQEYQYMLGQELEPSFTDSQPLFLSLPLRSSHRPSQTPRTPPTPIPQRRRIDGHDYDYTNVESMYIPMPSVMRQVSSLIDSQARAGSRDDLDLDLAIHPSSRHHHSKHTFGYGSGSYSGSRSGSASDLSAWAKAKGATTSTSGSDLSSLVLDDHGALFDLDLETS